MEFERFTHELSDPGGRFNGSQDKLSGVVDLPPYNDLVKHATP